MHNIQPKKPFGIVLGNPPFSEPETKNKGAKSVSVKRIYPDFFRKATELSDVVAMIIPNTEGKSRKDLVSLNNLINENLQSRIDTTDHFNISVETQCVYWDKNKEAKDSIPGAKDGKDILPERNRLPKFSIGNHYTYLNESAWPGVYAEPNENTVECVVAVSKKGLTSHWINPSETKEKVKVFMKKHVVIMPCALGRFNKSLSDAHYFENTNGLVTSVHLATWEFDTKESADDLIGWLNSEEFKKICSENKEVISRTSTFRNMPFHS